MKKKKCCVIGLGYIGIPTSIVAAGAGFNVVGVDINTEIVNSLNEGVIPIIEPNLNKEFQAVLNKNFKAQIKPCKADIFIISVPTPFNKKSKKSPTPDISYVLGAVKSIIPFIQENNLIILESTSPVGTTNKIAEIIYKDTGLNDNKLNIAYCPERVLPGNIIKEIKENDRVIGGINNKSAKAAKAFYSEFCRGELKITDTKTAELVKLTENSFRDVNIAFANELSMICSDLEIDASELIRIANCHPRVNILNPGTGVGGHCIAVDPWFIVSSSPDKSNLIKTARDVNNKKTEWVSEKIKDFVQKFICQKNKKPLIGCFGLTFKPDIDDIRESSAIKVIKSLILDDYKVICCEPNLNFVEEINLKSSSYLIDNCDILVFLVAHKQFKNLNIQNKEILDFCNALNY